MSAVQTYRMRIPIERNPIWSTIPVHPVSVFDGEKKIISGNESGTSPVSASRTLYTGLVSTPKSVAVGV